MGRTKEVMITYHRRRMRKRRRRRINICPLCGGRLDRITLATAVEFTRIDQSTLQEWITLGKCARQRIHHRFPFSDPLSTATTRGTISISGTIQMRILLDGVKKLRD